MVGGQSRAERSPLDGQEVVDRLPEPERCGGGET